MRYNQILRHDACLRPSTLIEAPIVAALAQLVEHIIRNDGATGSSPVSGTIPFSRESGIYCESAFQQVTHLGPAWVTLGRKKDLTYAIPT